MLLDRAEIRWSPFPHCVIYEALPWDLYNDLDKARPPDVLLARGRTESNVRVDVATREIQWPEPWKSFIDYHTGPFWHDVVRVFGGAIRFQYPELEWDYGPLDTWSVGVRRTGRYHLHTECQLGINTPCLERSRVRGPHLDNKHELYAGLFYMPAEGDPGGGDLQICKVIKKPRFYGKCEIMDEDVEVVETVQYQKNTFVFFINGPLAVHSVTERGPCKEFRRLVNIIGEVGQELW